MWNYEKRLEYPVNITTPNAKIAQIILSQYGGPDGEIGASMRYLSQRFTASNRTAMAVLTDVGTEELAHLEMVATIVHQLTRNLSAEELEKAGFAPYYAIRLGSGHSRQVGIRFLHQSYSQPVIRSQICLRIWRRSRRHG